MDDKKSLLTTLPPLLVAAGTLITAVIGLGNFMSSPAPSITEFDVSPSIIDIGGNATLKWAVSGDVYIDCQKQRPDYDGLCPA